MPKHIDPPYFVTPNPSRAVVWIMLAIAVLAAWIAVVLAIHTHDASDLDRPGPVVRLDVKNGYGSGFAIGHGFLITAAHVAQAPELPVEFDNGKTGFAHELWKNTEYDIALYHTSSLTRFVHLDCREPTKGEAVSLPGSPLNINFITLYGHAASGIRHQIGEWRDAFFVDASGAPGDSGGPVLDHNGHAIGVTVGTAAIQGVSPVGPTASPYPITVAVPATTVCMLLGHD